MKILLILTIINTIAIIYLLLKNVNFSYRIHTTTFNKTKTGIQFYSNNKGFFYIPIRNRKKVELREDIQRLIASSDQNRLQTLTAIFSWLKTKEEVQQFEKDYTVVDRKIVENLVASFNSKM